MGNTRLHVVHRPPQGWRICENPGEPSLHETTTKTGAVRLAVSMLEPQGGVVVIHRRDGSVEAQQHVAPVPTGPWWYLRPHRLWWLVASSFVIQGGVRVFYFEDDAVPAFSWSTIIVGVAIVIMTALSRRLDRRRLRGQF